MVVVEHSPKVILSSFRLRPIPVLLDSKYLAVHVFKMEAVVKFCKFGFRTKLIFADGISSFVTIDFDASNGVSDDDDSSSPALIERLVGVVVGSEVREKAIVRSVHSFGEENASYWQFLCTGGVSKLRIAAVAGHPADPAVFLFRPNGRLESHSFLIGDCLPVIRVVLADSVDCQLRLNAEGLLLVERNNCEESEYKHLMSCH